MALVEFEGRDLEEAIGRAASALNMPPERVKFSVLSMGAKGFLGLGRKKARLAVDPDDPALSLEEPEDKPRERHKPAPHVERKPQAERSSTAEKKTSVEAPAPAALRFEHLPPLLTRPQGDEMLVPGPGDAAGELALTVTREIVRRLGFEAEISAARIGSRVILSLESPDNALLIGVRGSTLEALQLLVGKILARQQPEADCRVLLDVADYRRRRREHLLESLKNLAEQARRSRRPQSMSGLSADERRLVQLALRPFKDLRVLSGGPREGLTISPTPPPGSHRSRPRRHVPAGQK